MSDWWRSVPGRCPHRRAARQRRPAGCRRARPGPDPILQAKFAGRENFSLNQGDALKFDFSRLSQEPASLRIVGNLPYNISTPLIFHLLEHAQLIRDMHFMLQKEVVERLAAQPGGGDWGRLSIMVQYHCRVEHLFNVGPGAFNPAPKVDSAIVRLVPHETLPHPARDHRQLERVVRERSINGARPCATPSRACWMPKPSRQRA